MNANIVELAESMMVDEEAVIIEELNPINVPCSGIQTSEAKSVLCRYFTVLNMMPVLFLLTTDNRTIRLCGVSFKESYPECYNEEQE